MSLRSNIPFLCSLILIFQSASLSAQTNTSGDPFLKSIVQQPPNVSSIGKFIETPVGYHTGIPDITIPIYRLTDGVASQSISLSYHAGGIRVSELASSVGLGWALNANGIISRTVRGIPDEGYSGRGYYTEGGLRSYNYLLGGTPSNPQNPCENCGSRDYTYDDFIGGQRDGEPDLFSFSFEGYSGKFVFDEYKEIRPLSENDLRFAYFDKDHGNYFVITTPDGVDYYFGEGTARDTIDSYSSRTGNSVASNRVPSSWHLTKVVYNQHGQTLYYDYDRECFKYYDLGSETVTAVANQPNGNYFLQPAVGHNLVSTTVLGKRLRQIRSSNLIVKFIYNTTRQDLESAFTTSGLEPRMLDEVQVLNATGKCYKRVVLTHSYYQSAVTNYIPVENGAGSTDTKRLLLNSVQEYDGFLAASKPPHQIVYNTAIAMPRRLCYAQDWWGFYNGQTGNSTLLPSAVHPITGASLTGANRNTSSSSCLALIIQSIRDPLGGSISFQFVAHSSTVGGLRIEKITKTDPVTQKNIVTKYVYSGGFVYNDFPSQAIKTFGNDLVLSLGITPPYYQNKCNELLKVYWSGTNVAPLQTTSGQHIGYSYVKEIFGENGENGYIERTYNMSTTPKVSMLSGSNYLDGSNQATSTNSTAPASLNYAGFCGTNAFPQVPEQADYYRGTIHSETVFDANGLRISEKVYDYDDLKNETKWIRGFKVDRSPFYASQGATQQQQYYPIFYKLNTSKLNLKSVLTKSYNKVTQEYISTLDEYYYESDKHHQVTRKATTNSKGEKITDVMRYSFDFVNSGSNGDLIHHLKSANLLVPLREETWKNDVLISSTINQYQYYGIKSGTYWINSYPIKVAKVYAFESSDGFSIATAGFAKEYIITPPNSIPTTLPYKEKVEFAYSQSGNLNSQKRTNNLNESFIWDNLLRLPVAKAQNTSVDKIAYTSFETDDLGGWTGLTGNRITNYDVITGKKYGSGGLSKTVATGNYVVTLWCKGNCTVNNVPGSTLYVSKRDNSWRLLEWKLNAVTSISILADNMDEVRLRPEHADITTYTYEPGVGISSICDVNNRITQYIYDGLGRLILQVDIDGNILKDYCYTYANQTSDCTIYSNTALNTSITKNDCGPGYLGSSVNYSVNARQYFSNVSLADANLKAQDDITINGQSYANRYGSCIAAATVNATNSKTAPYNVRFTNNTTGENFPFTIPANSSLTAYIPLGTYTVLFYPAGTALNCTFSVNGSSQSGTGATFNNVSMTSSSTVTIF
jgi:YD repeat-containing protein